MDETNHVGRVVYSKAGRDKGRYFIIVGILDENYVYVCDGSLRNIEKPKKKKVKHLFFTHECAEKIKSMILNGESVNNAQIRKFLQSYDTNKEV